MSRRLELYTREGCHLCTRMLEQARPIADAHGVPIVPVDIDADPQLRRRHNERIPVLVLDGTEICHHFLDADALERALAAE